MNFIKGQEPRESMGIGVRASIQEWLLDVSTHSFNISEDLKIESFGKIQITDRKIEKLPDFINFYKVIGGFYCSNIGLKSLRGTPSIIELGSFICADNLLKNLVDGPQKVDGSYITSYNKLTSLKGLATEISGSLAVNNNQLTSLKGCPETIYGDFHCNHNPLKNLKYLPSKIHGTLYISYTREFEEQNHKNTEKGRLFIEEIQKRCIAKDIKIM